MDGEWVEDPPRPCECRGCNGENCCAELNAHSTGICGCQYSTRGYRAKIHRCSSCSCSTCETDLHKCTCMYTTRTADSPPPPLPSTHNKMWTEPEPPRSSVCRRTEPPPPPPRSSVCRTATCAETLALEFDAELRESKPLHGSPPALLQPPRVETDSVSSSREGERSQTMDYNRTKENLNNCMDAMYNHFEHQERLIWLLREEVKALREKLLLSGGHV